MLAQSDRPIAEVIREFAQFGVEAAYFVPTQTGLAKSIIDAHESLRRFFRSKGFHDFDHQGQGSANKVVVDVDVVTADHFDLRTMSLYRPETKTGDPRFWVSRMGDIARPGNLMALFVATSGRLTLVNCSDAAVWSTRGIARSPLNTALVPAEGGRASE